MSVALKRNLLENLYTKRILLRLSKTVSVSQYAARRTVGFIANVRFINEGYTKI